MLEFLGWTFGSKEGNTTTDCHGKGCAIVWCNANNKTNTPQTMSNEEIRRRLFTILEKVEDAKAQGKY